MKSIYNKIFGFGLAVIFVPALTGCIEEIEPTTIVTAEQAAESPTASEALQMAMPAYLNRYTDTGWHYSYGYAAQMMIRNMLGGDEGFNVSTYSGHFARWGINQYQGADYVFAGYVWSYYYGFLLAVNNMVGAVDPENANEAQLGALGTGLAYRALIYLDLARLYEFLPNDVFTDGLNADGNNVLGLTVPIVTDKTEVSVARNNPRATHEEMYEFILSDLENAEKYIVNQKTTSGQVLPDLSCVYGLKARLYMWNEDYANAQKYARLAIDNAKVPVISQERALSKVNGMNTASDFMWAGQMTSEDNVVQTGIINWISWASNQTTFGYTGPATEMYLICDANFYNRISNTDWRKLWFQAPEGSPLRSQIQYMTADDAELLVPYASLKFRPAQGNISDYSVGAAASYPVMRVEEMYFIEAEAAAQQNPSAGLELLKNFMTAYRDPNYATRATDKDAVIDEIVFQKEVELWGEGQRVFDVKRLNIPVTRGYKDTPFYSQFRLNTTTRPAWTNLVISRNEVMNNSALKGFNNPDPSDKYTIWTEETAED
ncbi:MAG: RagB/SusD family nutrient uptake outer membrane protein [Bacteroidaceae bacterium]|nr:RagB/SusD family nutrient uptake outer membrane protein [Bacteroidaceae bacterium]